MIWLILFETKSCGKYYAFTTDIKCAGNKLKSLLLQQGNLEDDIEIISFQVIASKRETLLKDGNDLIIEL